MKKKLLVLSILALCAPIMLTSCGDQNGSSAVSRPDFNPDDPINPVSISFSANEYNVVRYENLVLAPTVTGSTQKVNYTTNNASVATVSEDGTVHGVAIGIATITAEIEGCTASVIINVIESSVSPSLRLSHELINMYAGDSFEVSYSVSWGDEDVTALSTISYEIKDPTLNALSVSVGNSSLTLIALKRGSVSLSVLASIRGKTIAKEISVNILKDEAAFEPKDVASFDIENGQISKVMSLTNVSKWVKTFSLDFNVFVGKMKVEDAYIEWTSSNPNVASVKNGTVTAIENGTTEIVGFYDGGSIQGSVTIHVSVETPRILFGDGLTIDLNNLTAIDIDPSVTIYEEPGEISKVLYEGIEVGTCQNHRMILNKDSFPKQGKKLGKGKSLKIVTSKAEHEYTADVFTMLIKSKEDFASMTEVAKSMTTSVYSADGYFALGANIEYNDTFDSMFGYPDFVNKYGANRMSFYSEGGFFGTFDGQGHYVKGLELTVKPDNSAKGDDGTVHPRRQNGGIFTSLGTGSIIKNVAFIDSVCPAGSGYICSSGDGLIDNVNVQFAKLSAEEGWKFHTPYWHMPHTKDYAGAFYTNGIGDNGQPTKQPIGPNAKVINSVVDAVGAEMLNENTNWIYYTYSNGEFIYQSTSSHVMPSIFISGNKYSYCYNGFKEATVQCITICEDADVLSNSANDASLRFSSYDEIASSGNAQSYIKGLDSTIWGYRDGKPTFRSVLADFPNA